MKKASGLRVVSRALALLAALTLVFAAWAGPCRAGMVTLVFDDGLSSVETDPPQRHRRHHARGLAMPYFSFAQSLRSRN